MLLFDFYFKRSTDRVLWRISKRGDGYVGKPTTRRSRAGFLRPTGSSKSLKKLNRANVARGRLSEIPPLSTRPLATHRMDGMHGFPIYGGGVVRPCCKVFRLQ